MLLNKISETEQNEIGHLLDEFFKKFPERDDDNNLPDNSNVQLVIVSPLDHWLTWAEAEKEIRGFVENPTNQMINRFRHNEEKCLRFISQYLKSRQFFYGKFWHEIVDDKLEYHRAFYTCSPESDFYEPQDQHHIFLPILNVSMVIDDDYSIKFEILKTSQSNEEISSIIQIAEDSGLFVNENK